MSMPDLLLRLVVFGLTVLGLVLSLVQPLAAVASCPRPVDGLLVHALAGPLALIGVAWLGGSLPYPTRLLSQHGGAVAGGVLFLAVAAWVVPTAALVVRIRAARREVRQGD